MEVGNRNGDCRPSSQFCLPLCPSYLRDLGVMPFPFGGFRYSIFTAESLSRDECCVSGSCCLSGSGPLCAFGVLEIHQNGEPKSLPLDTFVQVV